MTWPSSTHCPSGLLPPRVSIAPPAVRGGVLTRHATAGAGPLRTRRCIPVLALLAAAGCAEGPTWNLGGQSTSAPPMAPPEDVGQVICLYQQPYFKSFDREGDRNPEGFKFNMYLGSRKTGRGVLTHGTLQTRMYRRDPQPDGSVQRTEVCAWTQDLADVPRTTQEFALGWAYVPHFYWGDADVLGTEVEIVTWYEAPDGRKVYAQTQTTKVPAPK